MITIDDLKEIERRAIEEPIPHEGLAKFMKGCGVTYTYYCALYHIAKLIQPDLSVELGTELGRGAYAMAAGCPEGEVITVEILGIIPSTWMEFLGELKNIKIVCGTRSDEWLLSNRSRKIDFLHVDSTHDYPTALSDICLALPLMRQGGVIAMDDIRHEGTKKVWDLLNLPKLETSLHGENGYGFLIVT